MAPKSTTAPSPDSVRSLTVAVLATASVLIREGNRLFRGSGITSPQFNALKLLADSPGGMLPSELAAHLVVDPSSATYILRQLERKGWLSRSEDPGDRRVRRVKITPTGRSKYASVEPSYRLGLGEIARQFGGAELRAAAAIVEKLRKSAGPAVDRVASMP